jgi:hypothetical protein
MKSNQSIYLGLWVELYRDIAMCYSVTQRMQRIELSIVKARFDLEGISFLTKALPLYAKAVDTALSSGRTLKVRGFKLPSDSVIPKFLGWLLMRVFNTAGDELVSPDPTAYAHFKQLTHLLYKLELPYDKTTEETVIESFINVDHAIGQQAPCSDAVSVASGYCCRSGSWRSDEWLRQARALVARVVTPLDPTGIKPRHGPGAVSTGESTCEKSNFSRIYSRLEVAFPFTEWFYFNLNHVVDAIPAYDPRITTLEHTTAKVVLVPKDSRGPRLISCEPLEIQWIQQGLKTLLVERIESFPLTKGFVNFTDQSVNRKLALEGSKDGRWVTLDMKDASDRVSLELVKYLFQDNALLLAALLAARSDQTKLPNGTVVTLNKFAPMGSAVCFPVEALVFWALSVSAIRCTRNDRKLPPVYVYGDDIIVRDSDYTTLLHHLPQVGLMFNVNKCCTARFLRESCGCDAYVGVDVTPVKLKTVWSYRRSDPKCLESYTAFYNAMYGKGHFHAAEFVRKELESVYGLLPRTNNYVVADNGAYVAQCSCPALVCNEPSAPYNRALYKPRHRKGCKPFLFYAEYYCWTSVPAKVKSPFDGYSELLRRYSVDYGPHGGVYALVRRNRLKRTWIRDL